MKKITVTTALMWRICALTLGIWLAAMGYLTVLVAQDLYGQALESLRYAAPGSQDDDDLTRRKLELVDRQNDLDGMFWMADIQLPWYRDPFRDMTLDQRIACGEVEYETAVVYLDAEGRPIDLPRNYAIVRYMDEEPWYFGNTEYPKETYIDLDETAYGRKMHADWGAQIHSVNAGPFWQGPWRYTGYFQDGYFHVAAVHHKEGLRTHLMAEDRDQPTGALDKAGHIAWETLFDETEGLDRELVRIYSDGALYYTIHTSPLTVGGQDFQDLNSLLQRYLTTTEKESLTSDSLWNAVIVDEAVYTDMDGQLCSYAAAIHCHPMKTAMMKLTWVYLITLLPVVLLLLQLGYRIHWEVGRPLSQIVDRGNMDMHPLPKLETLHWAQPHLLQEGYTVLQSQFHQLRNEKRQLHAALDYAKDAEQDRRELVSGITHELKTPLAVIHSYAEGLRCDINAEKRDQYLQVILEETERMDAMVLEMLDLSRLEAGKVRLSVDQFRLLERTRGIMDRLAPLLEEKSLKVEYPLAEDVTVTADESRICQVIENLATNAIKFAPEGGTIWIEIFRTKDGALFSIENEGEGIPEEALERIFQSFYRTEASRTTKGTGLGLAIAKSVIDLHGGTIRASNTQTGVQFSFTLP